MVLNKVDFVYFPPPPKSSKYNKNSQFMLVSLKIVFKPGMVVNTFNPSTGKVEADGSQFEVSLIYTVSSRLGRGYIVRLPQ